jgi:hypothetical protein
MVRGLSKDIDLLTAERASRSYGPLAGTTDDVAPGRHERAEVAEARDFSEAFILQTTEVLYRLLIAFAAVARRGVDVVRLPLAMMDSPERGEGAIGGKGRL